VLSFNDFAEAGGLIKRGQNVAFHFNRRTLSAVQQIVDSMGRPLWQFSGGDQPATIYGYPYSSEFIDLDDAQNGSNAYPIIVGDMQRGYEIFDMTGIITIRDEITMAGKNMIRIHFHAHNTGRVLMEDALLKMQIR